MSPRGVGRGRRPPVRQPRSSPRPGERPARRTPTAAVMPKIQEQVADICPDERDRHIHDLKKKVSDFRNNALLQVDRNRHLEAQVKEQRLDPLGVVESEELMALRTKVANLKAHKRQDVATILALKQRLTAHRGQGAPCLLSDAWTPTCSPRGVECSGICADDVTDSPQAFCVREDATAHPIEGLRGSPVPKLALGTPPGRARPSPSTALRQLADRTVSPQRSTQNVRIVQEQVLTLKREVDLLRTEQAKRFGTYPHAAAAGAGAGREPSPRPGGAHLERTPAEVNELLARLESSCLDSARDSVRDSFLEPTNLGDLVERVAQRVDDLLGAASSAANRSSPVVSSSPVMSSLQQSPPSASQESNRESLGSPVLHIEALQLRVSQKLQDRDRDLCFLQETLRICEARLVEAEATLAVERSAGLSLRLEAQTLRRACSGGGKENDAPEGCSSANFSVSDCSVPKHCWPPQAPVSHKHWQASSCGSQSCATLTTASSRAGSHTFAQLPSVPIVVVRGRSPSPSWTRSLSQTRFCSVSVSRSPSPALSCRSISPGRIMLSPGRIMLSPRRPPRVSASVRTLTQQVDMLVKIRDLPPRRQSTDGSLVLRSQWRMVKSPIR